VALCERWNGERAKLPENLTTIALLGQKGLLINGEACIARRESRSRITAMKGVLMFNSGLLDVAIGLIFIYPLLGLICTALSEMIEARLKMRATDLERGIRELLHDPTGQGLVKKLYDHLLVFGLFQGLYDPSKIKNGRYRRGANLRLSKNAL
jgi:hypothetical protein